MYFRLFVLFLLAVSGNASSSERRRTIERVRNYLREYDSKERFIANPSSRMNWLENSNKIGFGYNLLSGSPVCYTGACQMAGFTRSIFKLNYVSPVPGSCTSKLVPDHVELDCLPSTSLKAGSETIATVEQLKKSISDKVEVSVSAKYMVAAFSYSFSKETRSMIDNIVKHDTTSIFTTAQVSYAKLSMFEPRMELSDNFRYVIENMPCCEMDDADIEEYIKDFILDYFGFTYITSILLGGIAQQNIFINRKTHEKMVSEGTDTKHQAQVAFEFKFGASAGTSVSNSQNTSTYNSFMNQTQSTDATTLGGDPHLTTLPEWSKTVPSNPVVIQFAVRDIFRLLTKRNFPNDALITKKSVLIELALDKYLNKSVYCYNDCGGDSGTRGTCVPTGHFQFGVCQCKSEWTGPDCTTPVNPTHRILHGTICGLDRSFVRASCEGRRPYADGCPPGWIQKNWKTDLTVCFKNGASEAKPVVGTLCGIYVHQLLSAPNKYETFDIPCNNFGNVLSTKCPDFYQQVTGLRSNPYSRNAVCASLNAEKDLSGTICGMQIDGTIDGPDCDGHHPGLHQCPPNYTVRFTSFNWMGYRVCVKN